MWSGSAFNCAEKNNEVFLPHNQFGSSSRRYSTCNNKTISGRGVRVLGRFYASQLSVKVSSDLIGKTIECVHDDVLTTKIGSSTLLVTTGKLTPEKYMHIICSVSRSYT